jgi:peptidoglycan/LPS O-acetylase OafA/YrhL
VVFFGFFIYPGGPKNAFWLSILFLPNLAFCLNLLPAVVDPIWSIGTEEQFYIFHPHFFRFNKLQHILYALLLFIAFILLVGLMISKLMPDNSIFVVIHNVLYYARFDNMMVGAVVAVIYYNTKHPEFNFKFQWLFDMIFKKQFQLLLLITFAVYLFIYQNFYIPHGDILIAAIASLLIVNLCEPDTSIYSLNHKYLDYIGKISYGIYLLHKFCLFLILYLVQRYLPHENMIMENIIIYGATIAGAIGIASLSYYGYERPFLQIKKRFQKITQ